MQMMPSVDNFPFCVMDCISQSLINCRAGLELPFESGLQATHCGSGLVKINCKKGINIPMDTMEKTILSSIKRKYNIILPL